MMSAPSTPTIRPKPPGPSSFLCKYCGQVWLYWSTLKSPKGVPLPLTDAGQFHDCPLSDYNLKRKGRLRAVALKKSAIKNIEDFAMIVAAQREIAHINNRLGYHKLGLSVK